VGVFIAWDYATRILMTNLINSIITFLLSIFVIRAWPHGSLILLRHRREAFVDELLQAFSFVGLGGVDVALRIGGDAMDGEELAGLASAVAETGQNLHRRALDDVDLLVLPVGQVDVFLLRVF